MNKETNITAQAMRQDILNRLDASHKAIMELSDDELESIVGGWKGMIMEEPKKPMKEADRRPRWSDSGFESPDQQRAYRDELHAYFEHKRSIGR